MTGPLYALGRWCARHRLVVVAVWIVVVVALAGAARGTGQQTSDNLTLPGTGSQQASDLLANRFPVQANGAVPIAMKAPPGAKLTEPRYEAAISQVASAYAKDHAVIRMVSPLSAAGKAQLTKPLSTASR